MFVADFMGFRNFFPGHDRRRTGSLSARTARCASAGADRTRSRPAQPATAAIRPEDVQVGADAAGVNQFRGRVEIVEYLGRDNEAVLRLEDQSSLWVHTPAHLAPGETVSVTFPPDKVIFLPGAPDARP